MPVFTRPQIHSTLRCALFAQEANPYGSQILDLLTSVWLINGLNLWETRAGRERAQSTAPAFSLLWHYIHMGQLPIPPPSQLPLGGPWSTDLALAEPWCCNFSSCPFGTKGRNSFPLILVSGASPFLVSSLYLPMLQ